VSRICNALSLSVSLSVCARDRSVWDCIKGEDCAKAESIKGEDCAREVSSGQNGSKDCVAVDVPRSRVFGVQVGFTLRPRSRAQRIQTM
jgi:hypothetical protein